MVRGLRAGSGLRGGSRGAARRPSGRRTEGGWRAPGCILDAGGLQAMWSRPSRLAWRAWRTSRSQSQALRRRAGGTGDQMDLEQVHRASSAAGRSNTAMASSRRLYSKRSCGSVVDDAPRCRSRGRQDVVVHRVVGDLHEGGAAAHRRQHGRRAGAIAGQNHPGWRGPACRRLRRSRRWAPSGPPCPWWCHAPAASERRPGVVADDVDGGVLED